MARRWMRAGEYSKRMISKDEVLKFDSSLTTGSYGTDYFGYTDSIENHGWTIFDFYNNADHQIIDGKYVIKVTTPANTQIGSQEFLFIGAHKPVPSEITGSFQIMTKIKCPHIANIKGGVFISEDLDANPTGSAIFHGSAANWVLSAQNARVYGAARSTFIDDTPTFTHQGYATEIEFATDELYIRLRVTGSTVYTEYSFDGAAWGRVGTNTLTLSSISKMGVFHSFSDGTTYIDYSSVAFFGFKVIPNSSEDETF